MRGWNITTARLIVPGAVLAARAALLAISTTSAQGDMARVISEELD